MSSMTIATAVGICTTSTYSFLTNSLGKPKVCAKYITCSTMTKEPCVFLPPPICGVGETKAMHFWIVFKRLTSNGCIHLTLSWNGRMLKGMPESHRERKLHFLVRLLWKSCTSCSSAEIDFYLTIPCQFVRWWVTNVTPHSCKRLGWLFDIKKKLELVSFYFRTMEHIIAPVVCKIGYNVGPGRCWHKRTSLG